MSIEQPTHKQFEARLIQLLRWRFEKSNLGVKDHLKVGNLPLEIDVVVISFTDLPDELMTEELRTFSDPARRRQTLISCLGDQEKTPIVETIFDLYESEVKRIMLNIREESLRNVLSVVDPKRIVAALGDEKVIAALGDEKIIAALGDEKIIAALDKQKLQAALTKEDLLAAVKREEMINALAGNENFLKALLAKLDAEQLRKLLEEKSRH